MYRRSQFLKFYRPSVTCLFSLGILLGSSPLHAEPYPQAPQGGTQLMTLSPTQQQLGQVQSYSSPQNPTTNLGAVPQPSQDTESDNQRAQLTIQGTYDATPTSNVNGGTSYGIETNLYSATIDNRWRLFAGEYYSHEVEPIGEGTIAFSRASAGLEYHYRGLTASLAPNYNTYNSTERVGVTGDASWDINSHWTVGGEGQLFSRDIPLRALNSGITANSYNGNATWSPNDDRDIRLDADFMTFSDANFRSSVAAAYTEHLYTGKDFNFDGLVSLVESNNTENEARPYFNPSQDVLGNIGGRLSQPLYENHGFLYLHSIEVTEGSYWQQNYGASPAVTASYKQRLHSGDNLDAGAGVSFTRQAADGSEENDIVFLLDVTERF